MGNHRLVDVASYFELLTQKFHIIILNYSVVNPMHACMHASYLGTLNITILHDDVSSGSFLQLLQTPHSFEFVQL